MPLTSADRRAGTTRTIDGTDHGVSPTARVASAAQPVLTGILASLQGTLEATDVVLPASSIPFDLLLGLSLLLSIVTYL